MRRWVAGSPLAARAGAVLRAAWCLRPPSTRAELGLRLLLFVLLAGLLLRGSYTEPLLQLVRGHGETARLLSPGGLAALLLLPLLGLIVWRRRRAAAAGAGAAAPAVRGGPGLPLQLGLVAAAAGAATGGALAAQILVFGRIPHVQDSINYLWQARVLASGRLSLPSHPLAEFFTFRFMVNDGSWYSLFQPGWPALLALGELAGAPWAVDPLLGGLLVLATWGVGREALGGRNALLGVLLLVCSPFFLFMQSTMMAHGASATLGTLVLWAYLAGRRRKSRALLVLAGSLLGALACTRSLDALVLAVPLGLHACWPLAAVSLGWAPGGDGAPGPRQVRLLPSGPRQLPALPALRARLVPLLLLAGPALAVGSLQLAYARALTGSALVWPQDRYFALTEANPRCHRLGFGRDVGCVREHGPDLGRHGFTPARAVQVSTIRLRSLQTDLWGPGLGLLLVAAGASVAGAGRRRGLLAAVAAAPLIGYFFYYYHGNCFGARYYYGALPALVLLAAAGLGRLAEAPPRAGALPSVLRPALVLALAGGTLLYSLAVEVPRLWRSYSGAYWGVHGGLAQLVAEQRLSDAVVLIPPSPHGPDLDDRDYRIGFVHARPEVEASPVVIARDLGPANPQLAAWFPGRRFFRYHPWDPPPNKGWLEPIVLDGREARQRLVFEAEAKFPPPRRSGGVPRIRRAPPAEDDADADGAGRKRRVRPGGHLLAFDPAGPGEWFELRQHVFTAGAYRIDLRLARGPEQGLLRLAVDGVPLEPLFDGYANRPLLTGWQSAAPVQLTPGLHTLRFTVEGASPASEGLGVGVDRVVLERVE